MGIESLTKKHKKINCENKECTNVHITLERISKKERTILGAENIINYVQI